MRETPNIEFGEAQQRFGHFRNIVDKDLEVLGCLKS
jgi:hypothetical protein